MLKTYFLSADVTKTSVLSAVALCALAVTGCSADDDGDTRVLETISCPEDDAGSDDAGDAGDAGTPDGSTPVLDGGIDSGTPDAATPDAAIEMPKYITKVTANGTGCPAGSWKVDAAGNLTFTKYEVEASPKQPGPQATVNCQLAVSLEGHEDLSFAVASFTYGGYAFLEQGTSLNANARYYWQGNPVAGTEENRLTLSGPMDSDFLLRDEVAVADRVWSLCGVTRDLNINTRIQVSRAANERSAYARVDELDLKGLKLAVRKCTRR